MPDFSGSFGGIVAPAIANNNFEIKPNIIQMVQNNQFGGLQGEDPYAHILTFLNICVTFKINGVTDDVIRLKLFLFSVRDKAQLWLASCQMNQSQYGPIEARISTQIFPTTQDGQVSK